MNDSKKMAAAIGTAVAQSVAQHATGKRLRARELGIEIGVLPPGKNNAITDVKGVLVGQVTKHDAKIGMHTGVTAIVPHADNIFQKKVPAGIFLGNGFGKMTGYAQVKELGNIETPIVLTNTLNVASGLDGIIDYIFSFAENKEVLSVNAVVGETNDGRINDIRSRFVTRKDVLQAITSAESGKVQEGAVGAGSGTEAFGLKAGIGTASRILPSSLGGWTIGVLVQANFGGLLTINGVQVGRDQGRYPYKKEIESADGSIMMIVATDAPLDARNLERVAKRSFMGMTRTGGVASNGSGDFVIAFSTAKELRIAHKKAPFTLDGVHLVRNDDMTPIFMATIEATEESILNALFCAHDVTGFDGKEHKALDVKKTLKLLKKHKALQEK